MRRSGLLLVAAPLVAACSDGSFVISNVDGAPLEAGEHDVAGATARVFDGFVAVGVVIDGDPDPCRHFSLLFCEADSGADLFVPDAFPDHGLLCSGPGRVQRGVVSAGFTDVCSGYGQWTAVRGEGRAEVDGDDVHLVFHAELEPEGFAPGTFEVDLEVDAGPPDDDGHNPLVDRPQAGFGD